MGIIFDCLKGVVGGLALIFVSVVAFIALVALFGLIGNFIADVIQFFVRGF